jgi:hypothetical protein
MKSLAAVTFSVLILAVALGGKAAVAPSARARTYSQAPAVLTAYGRLLMNFEALLRRTFHNQVVSVSRPENFSCAGYCGPLSKYRLYRFTFARPRGSLLHISKRTFGDNGEFGNYPVPVLIRGRAVACNARETRFLIAYRSTASFTLDCLPKGTP